jgi:hypothetical protein
MCFALPDFPLKAMPKGNPIIGNPASKSIDLLEVSGNDKTWMIRLWRLFCPEDGQAS